MPLTGSAIVTFEADTDAGPPPPPAAPPQYDAKVIRVRQDNEHAEHRLEAELQELGQDGWYPATAVGDFLILSRLLSPPAPPSGPVRGTLTFNKGANMGLTVDTTPGAESITYGFEDDHGNADQAPNGDGSGITVLFSSSDATLATVGDAVPGQDAAGNPTFTAPISVVTTAPATPGVTFSGAAANVDGGALTNNSGGAWVDPDPVTVPIAAGDPVEGTLSVAATPSV